MTTERLDAIEATLSVVQAEQQALRRLAERNETTLHEVLRAFEQLAKAQKVASDQANDALTIVRHALVLRPSEAPPEPVYSPTE
jgi:hypothetical protein